MIIVSSYPDNSIATQPGHLELLLETCIEVEQTDIVPHSLIYDGTFTVGCMGPHSTVGKLMNASLYLSNIMDGYRLFENLTSLPIPEKRL